MVKSEKLPKEWELVHLGNNKLFNIIMGQSPPSYTYNEIRKGLPFLQGKMDFGEIYPSPIIYCSNPIKIAKRNDILISVRAPVGEVNISISEVCIGRGLSSIRCNSNKAYYWFLFYYLKFSRHKLEGISSGSTFKAIRKNDVEKFIITLPPLPEQQKIAEILMTVDQAIEKVDEAIKKHQRLKKGLMHELLTKGIGHKEFKETEIGRIPKEWRVYKLGDISLNTLGGGTPSTSNAEYWDGEIAWMTSAHISDREISTGQRYITEQGLKNSSSSVVPKDNLIIATRVGIGKAAINRIDISISQDLTGVIINKNKSIPEFLYWILINNKNKIKYLAQGSTIKGILREELMKIKLPLPPITEQKKIAEILSTVDSRLEMLRKRKGKLEKVKKGLMNDLLTGRKRVKLDS